MKLFYEDGKPYLHIVGTEITSDKEILSIDIPKLGFPKEIYDNNLEITLVGNAKERGIKISTSGYFELLPVRDCENQQIFFTMTKEDCLSPKELTIKQIEKELGYPIKIVGEKNENN